MEKQYEVRRVNLQSLVDKLDKLSAKAVKCGQPPFELTYVTERSIPINGPGFWTQDAVVVFQLKAVQPKLNGWSFIATINHTHDGNIVRAMPGVDGSEWATVKAYCAHCQYTRKRNDSFIVRNEMGETKQVGRSCLSDFIGHSNPHAVAKYAELALAAMEACEHQTQTEKSSSSGPEHFDPKLHPYLDLRHFLAMVHASIRLFGWVSRAMSKNAVITPVRATADQVYERLVSGNDAVPPLAYDFIQADAAIDWVESLTEEETAHDTFLQQLVAVGGNGSGAFHRDQIGLVAALMSSFLNMSDAHATKQYCEEQGLSPWVGEVGASIDIKTKYTHQLKYTTSYNSTGHVLRFHDAYGRTLVVFMSPMEFDQLLEGHGMPVVGTPFKLQGYVAKHSVFRSARETVLGDVLITPLPPEL